MRARVWRWVTVLLLVGWTLGPLGCGGGAGGTAGSGAPSALAYGVTSLVVRAQEAVVELIPFTTGGLPTSYTATPPLPPGLELDPASGIISGTPQAEASLTDHTIVATNGFGAAQTTLQLRVGLPLPAEIELLEGGFEAELVVGGLEKCAKLALAPDGGLYFLEVDQGSVHLVHPTQGRLPTPFATIAVTSGSHQGVIGLTLDPEWAKNGYVYVMATVPASAGHADRSVVLRFTDGGAGVGSNPTTIIDDLPVASINNGGELLFDSTGHLLLSVGDAEDPALAQTEATTSLAGKILRFVPTTPASVPTDARQPYAGSPEWCRGLRNTFGLAIHPITGDLFGVDNGPMNDDELNYLAPGKNFEWGGSGGLLGHRILNWQDVIVPTALAWHSGSGLGSEFANNLFMTSYDDQMIRRFQMTGPVHADVEAEVTFARFREDGTSNKPLDIVVAPDGSLFVSTFTAIYHLRRL